MTSAGRDLVVGFRGTDVALVGKRLSDVFPPGVVQQINRALTGSPPDTTHRLRYAITVDGATEWRELVFTQTAESAAVEAEIFSIPPPLVEGLET